MDGLRFHIRGIVQGVGFRPYVYGLATSLKLRGWVRNSSAGVEIEIVGSRHSLSEFHRRLLVELPPLARVDTLEVHPMHGNFPTFTIVDSADDESDFIPVSPDVAICPDCVRELFDPSDRRFRYPFINCTNCGPRFTIIREIPYDRPLTTMAGFPLCHDCQKEYKTLPTAGSMPNPSPARYVDHNSTGQINWATHVMVRMPCLPRARL